jgi:tRNA G10  N-methylase Trm11
MDDSIVILGRQPALGLAELESLYGSENVRPAGTQAARLSVMPCNVDFARLGGAVRLCKLLSVQDTTDWRKIERFLVTVAPDHSQSMPEGKMHLGLSAYGLDITPERLLATGLTIKKAIRKEHERSVRLVPNKDTELNTAQVIHNKLTNSNGWELIFVRDGDTTIIAQTLFVQDIESYTIRDRSRPKRDARVGMLPPKLAQTIINLATGNQEFSDIKSELSGEVCLQPEDNQKIHAKRATITVLDPFCGTGVILQEALLMGYSTYGSDLEKRMVEYTEANLEWLKEEYKTNDQYRTEVSDATSHSWIPPINVVASETYLGRPFTATPSAEMLAQTAADCNLIIKKFLSNIQKQLKSGTRLCLAIPAWHTGQDNFKHLPLLDSLEVLGYNRVSFEHARNDQLLYFREGQIVARQLLVLTTK